LFRAQRGYKFTAPPFKEVRRINERCNFLIKKPEGRWLFRNTQLFLELDIAVPMVATTIPAFQQASRITTSNLISISPMWGEHNR
jgi:hypothetical protein